MGASTQQGCHWAVTWSVTPHRTGWGGADSGSNTQLGEKGFSGSSPSCLSPAPSGMEPALHTLSVSTFLGWMGVWRWGPASRLSPDPFGMELELQIPSPAQLFQPSLCQDGVWGSGKFSSLPSSLTQIHVPVGSPPWNSPQTSSAGFQLSWSPNRPCQPVTDRHSER